MNFKYLASLYLARCSVSREPGVFVLLRNSLMHNRENGREEDGIMHRQYHRTGQMFVRSLEAADCGNLRRKLLTTTWNSAK